MSQEKDQQIQSLQSKIRELEQKLEEYTQGGIKILFSGKANAQRIARKAKPRTLREIPELSIGSEEQKSKNLVIEGDNLLAMTTLYQYHGKIDLIITDPPYNTGKDFRYNDRWDEDPNDPNLGDYVKSDDPSRHTKWMKFMLPRLQMMRQMLKSNGVLAICIDDRELFRLGQMLDEVFGEKNRLAIINWQKAYAPKATAHVSSATEYVLVYNKNIEKSITGKSDQTEAQKERFSNPDNDPKGPWRSTTSLVPAIRKNLIYAIQNPFSGEIYYPLEKRSWRYQKNIMKTFLEEWDSEYEEKELNDGNVPGLILKGFDLNNLENPEEDPIFQQAREKAQWIYKNKPWPRLIFLKGGFGKIQFKSYFSEVRSGVAPLTWWASEDFGNSLELGIVSWPHQVSGHSQGGTAELKSAIQTESDFIGVKPLKLFQKIIQLWCPPNGLVLDPFAGSGTTAHAVLQLNKETGTNRSFILIEQGNIKNEDDYCRTLLQKRLQAAITGKWVDKKEHEPLGGGFKFTALDKQINNQAILQMERAELIDTIIASRVDKYQQKYQGLQLLKNEKGGMDSEFSQNCRYLIAKNSNNEGFFLIWDGPNKNVNFTKEVYQEVVQEAHKYNLKTPYHVYARLYLCQVDTVNFYQIPNSILLDFGFDLEKDGFN